MESVLGRYRNLIILVGVLFLQVLGLAVQVKRGNNNSEEKDTRLIRIWAVGAISPFERGIVWVQNSSGNIWHNYFYLRGVRAENRELKAQIEQMRLEQVRLTEDASQARRLQNLLAFKEQFIAKTVAAQVIGSSGSDLSRVVYIDKGKNAGIDRDMAVITADGIVGKVLLVYPNEAQVLLISDQSSGVGAILENSRLQGVLRGSPNGEVALERIMSDETVQPGETVLTSGGDQIFPKGLHVGTVTKVGAGKDLFLNIKIRPAADLSKLEEVLVLVEKQERQATAEDHVRVRAADILAQRLPSVPDKPATDPNTSSATSGSTATGATGSTKPASGVGTAAAGNALAKPTGIAASGTKPVSGTGTQQAGSKVTPSASQRVAGTTPVALAPVRNTKPKNAAEASIQAKPISIQAVPNNEQKPPPTTKPTAQPPAQEDSPQ
ncbi:MAG: rod shape-determining protein MreC [Candidatus Sulfotelmatobacter sp.]